MVLQKLYHNLSLCHHLGQNSRTCCFSGAHCPVIFTFSPFLSMTNSYSQTSRIAAGSPSAHASLIQQSGRSLFYCLTSSIAPSALLFPAAYSTLENSLKTLGDVSSSYIYVDVILYLFDLMLYVIFMLDMMFQQFVYRRPEEQIHVMKLVLDGFVLSAPLVEVVLLFYFHDFIVIF